MSNSRLKLRADDKPTNSSRGKGLILETPYKPGFVDDKDLETVKMAVDKELSEISNAFYQTTERTADTITRIDKIEIAGDTQYGDLLAKIEEVDKVSKEGDEAMAKRITTISAEVGDNKSSIVTESEARASADSVMTKRIDTILGSMQGDLGPLVGQFQEQIRVLGDTDGILAERITNLSAEYKTADETIKASVKTETEARVSADQSLTTQINTAKSELAGNIATVEQNASTEIKKVDGKVVKVEAKWGISTNVNGKITGISTNNDGKTGTVDIVADKFTISDGTNKTNPPFQVVGGHTRIMSAYINSIQSDNWAGTANSPGWAITRGGDAYFNNVTVRGTVHASTFTGVGAISSMGGASHGQQQSGTSEIGLGTGSVVNTSSETVLCIVEMFNIQLGGHCEVAVRFRNRTTGAYNTRYLSSNTSGWSTASVAGTVDVSPNATQSIEVTVQKTGGTGWWSAPDGHAIRGLHRKYS
ncbi:MAG: phage tail tip fiber protein [Bacteroidales bacterium]